MKKLLFASLLFAASLGWADTLTNRLGLTLPTIGSPGWGQKINGDMQIIDANVAISSSTNNFIFNQETLQAGATFYVSSATITNLNVTTINGAVYTPGGSGGTSTLNVSVGGTQISSPTSSVNFSSVTFSGNQSPTGTANILVTDVTHLGAVVNYAWLFNGSKGVWAPQGTSFLFSIASFSDALSSPIEIGTGTWKSPGAITFTAAYTNGPATNGFITGGTNLTMTNTFQGPTVSTVSVNYPVSPGSSVVFTLHASGSAGSATSSITHTFNNDRYWGVSTETGTYSGGDVTALASSDLTNSVTNTFTVTAGAGQYIVYAYPLRLGTATFTVGGFAGGFNSPQTLSKINGHGYTENYYVYRSVNSNLGATTVVVTTP